MLGIMILSNLMLKPCYGYELKRKLQLLNPNNNKIYPLLRRLAEDGIVCVRTENQDGKPARKVYEITDKGTELFVSMLGEFSLKEAHNSDEFYLRVAFFSLLTKETIDDILTKRETALCSHSQTLGIIDRLVDYPDPYCDILFLQNFLGSAKQAELRFIANLRKKYGLPPSNIKMGGIKE